MQLKRSFKLTATCNQCGYKISKDIVCDLSGVTEVKNQFAKEVSSIHKKHPELANFDVTYKLL